MTMNRIPADSRTERPGNPLMLGGGTRAVLALHGYTGIPEDMGYLAERLQGAGFAVSVPRLPGHGTNNADFHTTSWRDWLRRAVDAYEDLAGTSEEVSVVGLSMGGVLALLLASMFDPRRIALCAPAITNIDRSIVFAPIARWFLHRVGSYELKEQVDEAHGRLALEYWSHNWPGPAASLYKLQRMARRRLRSVRADTLTIVSRMDESVPVEAADIVARGISAREVKTVVLDRSPHVMVRDIEKERVADEVVAWFSAEPVPTRAGEHGDE